jgi:putative SOS response-associated peptidase YedK
MRSGSTVVSNSSLLEIRTERA